MPVGHIENICIKRNIDGSTEFTASVANSNEYKGALADCLRSLIQSVGFTESDKTIVTLSDAQRTQITKVANAYYSEIGEPLIDTGEPMVFIGG